MRKNRKKGSGIIRSENIHAGVAKEMNLENAVINNLSPSICCVPSSTYSYFDDEENAENQMRPDRDFFERGRVHDRIICEYRSQEWQGKRVGMDAARHRLTELAKTVRDNDSVRAAFFVMEGAYFNEERVQRLKTRAAHIGAALGVELHVLSIEDFTKDFCESGALLEMFYEDLEMYA